MTFKEIQMFLIKRYSIDAALAAETAKGLIEDHKYISDCPIESLKTRMEDLTKLQ